MTNEPRSHAGQRDLDVQMTPIRGAVGYAMTVDVEEWFHTCLIPEYVDPRRRPAGLAEELDFLLPEILELFDRHGCRATFFVLGETARRWPERIREIAAAGHEIASHGDLHLRAVDRPLGELADDLARSKAQLEELTGRRVAGFRAPEWSLRRPGHPGLRVVLETGYRYDSSLAPFAGAGCRQNPCQPVEIRWPKLEAAGPSDAGRLDAESGGRLIELPPMTLLGALRLPAGSWTGRLIAARRIEAAARRRVASGGTALVVVHPWELSGRPTPGSLGRGLARFVHETGRRGYRQRFEQLLAALPWQPIGDLVGRLGTAGLEEEGSDPGLASAPATSSVSPRIYCGPVRH